MAKINRLGYGDTVIPVKGFFEDTLPSMTSGSEYALVLVDCDLQESVRYCADTLWPVLAPGGVMVFDDYDSPIHRGAMPAIDAFVSARQHDMESYGLLKRLFYAKKQLHSPSS